MIGSCGDAFKPKQEKGYNPNRLEPDLEGRRVVSEPPVIFLGRHEKRVGHEGVAVEPQRLERLPLIKRFHLDQANVIDPHRAFTSRQIEPRPNRLHLLIVVLLTSGRKFADQFVLFPAGANTGRCTLAPKIHIGDS